MKRDILKILKNPHPVLKASRLKRKPVEVYFFDEKFVLFRGQDGKPVAVKSNCPHRGADLAKGTVSKKGELVCAYHGWRINANGETACPSIPKMKCKTPVFFVKERYGYLWLSSEDSELPGFRIPDFNLVGGFTSEFKAPLKVVLDNFGEIEHAFQVHKFIGPSEEILDSVSFTHEKYEDHTVGKLACRYRGLPLGMNIFYGIRKNDIYHNEWKFRFGPLNGAYHNFWTSPKNDKKRPIEFIINSFLVPCKDQVNVHVFLQMKVGKTPLRIIKPILSWFTFQITRYEIYLDSKIARFAPENSSMENWLLTKFDKQIGPNRKMMDELYFGETKRQTPKVIEETELA